MTEIPPETFAEAAGFRWLPDDAVGVNPTLFFKVEAFTATDSFAPTKTDAAAPRARKAAPHAVLAPPRPHTAAVPPKKLLRYFAHLALAVPVLGEGQGSCGAFCARTTPVLEENATGSEADK